MELLRDAVSINDLHRCHHSVCVEEQNDAVSPSEVLPGGGEELQCSFLYHKCYNVIYICKVRNKSAKELFFLGFEFRS